MNILDEIGQERRRQIEQEGFTEGHDDHEHEGGQIADAAACYAATTDIWRQEHNPEEGVDGYYPVWPWTGADDKRKKHSRRRRLVIAAALIVAEIERLDRQTPTVTIHGQGTCRGRVPHSKSPRARRRHDKQ